MSYFFNNKMNNFRLKILVLQFFNKFCFKNILTNLGINEKVEVFIEDFSKEY